MDPNQNSGGQGQAAPSGAQAQDIADQLLSAMADDKVGAMIANRIAPQVMKLIPAGRKLEAQAQDDKFPEWFLNVLTGRITEKSAPQNSADIIKTTDGFGIPTVAMPTFLQNLNFYSIARRWGARVSPAPSGKLNFTTDVVQNSAAIIAETGSYADKGEPSPVNMTLVKLGGRYRLTEEATEDTVIAAFEQFQQAAAIAIAKGENYNFLVGTGSGAPKGIFAEAATKTVASASAITYDELLEFDESLADEWDVLQEFDPQKPDLYKGPVYLMDPATAAYLRTLNDSGTPKKYYFGNDGKRLKSLFEYPLIRSGDIPNIGASAKVIAKVNFAGYVIAERRPNLAIKLTEDPNTLAINWNFAERVDGKLFNTAAAKILAMHA